MLLGGLQKTTLLDYPDKIACIVFTKGCNFSCGYCHNPELFKNETPTVTLSEFFDFLDKRVGKLDAVVVTGGEPTLHKDLPEFIKQIKNKGFLVKLDTNGTNFEMLKQLIDEKLLDYVAMDIKAPLEKYEKIVRTNLNLDNVKNCIEFLKTNVVDYEFRTTVVKSQLSFEDFEQIADLIAGTPKYYLQKFQATKILDETLMNETSYTDEEFAPIVEMLKQKIAHVEVR